MRATRRAVRDLRARFGAAGVAALFVVVALGTAALAYWTTTGNGSANASAATLNAPTGVTGTPVNSTVNVAFTGVSAPSGSLTGYYVTRYVGATPSNACGTVPGTTATYLASTATGCTDTSVPNGTYTYTVTAVFRTWSSTSAASANVVVNGDTTAPTQTVTLTSGAGTSYLTGGTIYYRGNVGGSFTLTDTVSDSGSGPASATFPALATAGWTHALETVSPGSGTNPTKTYNSSAYTWTANPTNPPTHTVTGADVVGNQVTTNLAFASDVSAPTGGALVAGGVTGTAGGATGYNTTGAYSLTRTDYSADTGSGLLNSVLVRDVAPFVNGVCGTYASATTLTGAPAESALATGCYRYTLTGTDRVTNAASLIAIVRVDRTAPTQSFTSTGANAYATGTTLFYNSNVGGSVVLRDAVTDGESGPWKVDFPAIASVNGWTHAADTITSGTGSVPTITYPSTAYTWIAGATSPAAGLRTTTAYDLAGNTATQAVAFTADATAPVTGALTANGTAATAGGSTSVNTSGTVTLARTEYTDAGSGLASSTLTREDGTLLNGVCSAYGAPFTIVGAPSQTGLANGCYRFTLTGTDNVGNTASLVTVVQVDAAPPTQVLSETGANSYLTGTTLYYRGGTAGSMTLTDTVTDTGTGPKQAVFPAFATAGWGHTASETVSTAGTPPTIAYTSSAITWTAVATTPPTYTVAGSDQANNTVATGLTFVSDSSDPTGGALDANGTPATPGGSTSISNTGSFAGTYTSWTDTGSGMAGEVVTRETGTLVNGVCGAYGSLVTVTWTSETGLPTGCYRYVFTGTDNVGNTSSVTTVVQVDRGNPTQAITATGANTFQSGTTVYYNNTLDGSFTLSDAVTDTGLGPASASFPAITSAGWTHAAETVSTGTGSVPTITYGSSSYAWTAGSAMPPTHGVVATDLAGNTGTTNLAITPDATGPTGGALSVAGTAATETGSFLQTTTGATWTIARTDFNGDADSGVATSVLTREFAAATACTTYSAPVVIVGTTDTAHTANGCYRYRLTGTDNVGNTTVLTVTMVTFNDNTAPTQAFTATGNGYATGTTVYYRSSAPGSFVLTSAVTDNQSGPKQVVFGTASTSGVWSHTAQTVTAGVGSPPTVAYTSTAYTWSSATPGNPSNNFRAARASDNDGNTNNVTLTFTADASAPTGGALTVDGTAATAGGSTSSTLATSFTGTRTDYSADTGSGLDTSVLTREYAPFSGGTTCGTFGTPTTVVGAPNESGLAFGCYRYTLTGADRVDNEASLTTTVKVVSGTLSQNLSLTQLTGQSVLAGSTVWYENTTAGSFRLTDAVTGTGLDPASATFPGLAGWGHTASETITTPSTPPTSSYSSTTAFSWAGGQTATPTYTVTGRNTGTDSVATTLTFIPDTTGPTGGALTVNSVNGTSTGTATTYVGVGGSISGTFTNYNADAGAGYQSTTLTQAYAATLTNGVCGTFAGPTTIATINVPTPSAGCYRYTLTGTDVFGNTSTLIVVVQVDLTVPSAVTLATPAGGNAYLTGTQMYYRASGGTATVNATVTDNNTSPASARFPDIATGGWTHADETVTTGTGAAPTITYASSAFTWGASPSVPGTYAVTGSDLAGNTATGSITTWTSDATAPTGGALTVNATAATGAGSTSNTNATSWTIGTRTDYNADTGSGFLSSVLTREAAPWSGTTCGTYAAPVTITGTTAQTGMIGGTCYRYVLTGTDRVGNTATLTTIVRTGIVPVSVTLNNGSFTAGTLNRTDTMVIQYSGPINVASMCSTWSGDTTNQSITADNVVGVTIQEPVTAGNDYITVSTTAAACGGDFNFGTVTLGDDGYLVSTTIQTFRGAGAGNASTIAYNASTYTLTITLGINQTTPGNDGSNNVNGNTIATYVPDAAILGTGGVPITTAAVNTANVRQF